MASLKIANTVQDVSVTDVATEVAALLSTLKDLDAQRIAKSDDIVVRKAVFGMLAALGRIEARVFDLEKASGTQVCGHVNGAHR